MVVPGFLDLISYGIEDHRGVVPVLLDHLGQIFPPIVHGMHPVIEIDLCIGPDVGILVHDIQPESVTGGQKLPADGIVGAADGVEAGVLQLFYSDLRRMRVLDGAEDPVVVVDTAPTQLDGFSVDAEPPDRIDGNRADAEAALRPVKDRLSFRKDRLIPVQIRMLSIPGHGIPDKKTRQVLLLAIGLHGQSFCVFRDLSAFPVEQIDGEEERFPCDRLVEKRRFHVHRGELRLQVRCVQRDAVHVKMRPFGHKQLDLPVDPGPCVPASAVQAVFHDHLDEVFPLLSEGHKRCRIDGKAAVAVIMLSGKGTVEIDPCVLIDPAKAEKDLFPLVLRREDEAFCVMAVDLLKEAVSVAHGMLRISRQTDRGVVGQSDFLGKAELVAQEQFRQGAAAALHKHPVVIERTVFHTIISLFCLFSAMRRHRTKYRVKA